MGLRIEEYDQPYGMLHKIRRWAIEEIEKKFIYRCEYVSNPLSTACEECLRCEKSNYCVFYHIVYAKKETYLPTRFKELVYHSDCDGVYVSYSKLKLKSLKRNFFCGDLDNLKKEVSELYKCRQTLKHRKSLLEAFLDFREDVKNANFSLTFR